MPCYFPLTAYRRPGGGISFSDKIGYKDCPVQLPCNQCIGCRLERSRQWALRCMHETTLHDENCYLTLTYNDENLPYGGSLNLKDFQLFMKRYRKSIKQKIKFFHCGEYGEELSRPHYHAIIFGHDFHDKKHHKTINENPLYISETLDKLWGMGHCTIGAATFDSAAYCARYILKKVTGDKAQQHYTKTDPYTGEVFELKPEYCTMSRGEGIGKGWFNKYHTDIYPRDEVIVKGKRCQPPKYYDTQFEKMDQEGLIKIKSERIKKSKQHTENNTPERLAVREKVKQAQIKNLPRS